MNASFVGFRFASSFTLKRHEMSHTENNILKCFACQKSFLRDKQLASHIRKDRVECKVCHKLLFPKAHARHMKLKHPADKFLCDICSKILATKSSLNAHSKIHNPKYVHSICGTVVRGSCSLKRHLIDNDLRPVKCNTCSVLFKYQNDQKKRDSVHSSSRERKYPCHICSISF